MRIIAGAYGGRKLLSPDTKAVRPTSDKVKGAIFSMIGDRVADAVAADIFAGTGSLGLEALSRGAAFCRFFDASSENLSLTARNIARCGAEARAETHRSEYARALAGLPKTDLIFLDPPYDKEYYVNCLARIDDLSVLASDGLVVVEHDARRALPERVGALDKIKEKRYGKTGVTIFRNGADRAASDEA